MHNEQILSLICGSIFLRGGTRPAFWSWAQRSVVVLGASKRYGRPSRGGAGVSLLGGELGKCGPPPPRVEAQALWGPTRRCKHHEAHP